jgi:hypothetical protein
MELSLTPVQGVFLLLCSFIVLGWIVFPAYRKEIALLIASTLLALVMAEAVVRLWFPQFMEHDGMFRHDEALGWTFIPDHKGGIVYPGEARHWVEINARGFRDDPVPGRGRPSRSLLVLGDSFVSNVSVRDEEVFTELMENSLADTAVLNFGVNGYGQVQQYLLLEKWYPEIDPDLVLVTIYLRNDFRDNVGGYWLYPRPTAAWDDEQSAVVIRPPGALLEGSPAEPGKAPPRSHLYAAVQSMLAGLADRSRGKDGPERRASRHTPPELYLCLAQPSRETGEMFRIMEALLLKIADYVESRGGRIAFVLAPSIVQVEDDLWNTMLADYQAEAGDYVRSMPNDHLMAFAERHGLSMLDLLPVLRAGAERGNAYYNRREQHWNKAGNEAVAEALLAFMRAEALLD